MPQIVTLDFETFYSRDFSLTKFTTEEYVRSPQFETIGVAIKIDNGETVWYPKPAVDAALSTIDWSDKMVVCQNTAFDGAIMAWRYNINPMAWFDILGMSRALYPHEKAHSLAAQANRAEIGQKGDEVLNEYVGFPGAKHDDEVDAAAHMGRALDEAHPAIVIPKAADRPRDLWGREDTSGESWKTA